MWGLFSNVVTLVQSTWIHHYFYLYWTHLPLSHMEHDFLPKLVTMCISIRMEKYSEKKGFNDYHQKSIFQLTFFFVLSYTLFLFYFFILFYSIFLFVCLLQTSLILQWHQVWQMWEMIGVSWNGSLLPMMEGPQS